MLRVVLRVPVWTLLVVTIHGNSWRMSQLLASSVILNNPPIFCYWKVYVAHFDLSSLNLFDSCQLIPLERKFDTVRASWIDVCDDPNVLDICSNDLFERLKSEFLLVFPFTWKLLCLVWSVDKGLILLVVILKGNLTGLMHEDIGSPRPNVIFSKVVIDVKWVRSIEFWSFQFT